MYSDPMSERLGRVVDQVLLDDAVFLGSKGLVEVDGEVEEIREIPQADLPGYAGARKGSPRRCADLRQTLVKTLMVVGFCRFRMPLSS